MDNGLSRTFLLKNIACHINMISVPGSGQIAIEFGLVVSVSLKNDDCFSLYDNLGVTFWWVWCLIHLGLGLVWFWTSYDSDVGLVQIMLDLWRFHDKTERIMNAFEFQICSFEQLVVSCVGLSFGWIAWCECGDDLHNLYWCVWIGEYNWCICFSCIAFGRKLTSNLEYGLLLQYGNGFDYLI